MTVDTACFDDPDSYTLQLWGCTYMSEDGYLTLFLDRPWVWMRRYSRRLVSRMKLSVARIQRGISFITPRTGRQTSKSVS